MTSAFWQLTVRTNFSSAHSLRNYKGKCENIHGHNYGVEVVVEGDSLTQDTELLMDFSDLKKILKEVMAKIDHCNLNEIVPFDTINPSSENLSRYLWQQIKPHLANYPVRLYSVTVSEKEEQSATYREVEK